MDRLFNLGLGDVRGDTTEAKLWIHSTDEGDHGD